MGKDEIEKFINRLVEFQPKFSERFKIKLSEEILKMDLGFAHIMVIKLLSTQEKAPIITDLAKQLSISCPMMTHIIDRIESKGLACRARDSSNRRIIKIELTNKGKKLLEKFKKEQKNRILTFLEMLSPKERVDFINSFNTLMDIMEKKNL